MRRALRVGIVLSVMASVLVPALTAPARTLWRPSTMARTLRWAEAASHPAAARFGFPATHIGFSWVGPEGSKIEYRTIASDGTASDWAEAAEAHDAEREPLHFSGVQWVNRSSTVEWRAAGKYADRVSNVTLDYMNTLDGDLEEVTVPATAEAAARTPRIITRAEWGADESLKRTTGGCRRQFHRVQQLFVHHTAGANFDEHPKATMRAIYWFHVARQGWCDIGYNFVVSADGRVFEGRWARPYAPFEVHDAEDRYNRVVSGAHTEGYNSGSVGISLMGNYSTIPLPPAARRALAELLAWEADRHNLAPTSKHTYRNPETGARRYLPFIAGHRDAGSTSCPGDYVYGSLGVIRNDTKAAIGKGKLESVIRLKPAQTTINNGEPANFVGTLTDSNGTPLAAQPIRSFARKVGGEWYVGPTTTTAADGTFTFTLAPSKRTRLVAIYDGTERIWGAESPPADVSVRATVTLGVVNEGAVDVGGVSHLPPGTTAVTLAGSVRPRHPGVPIKLFISQVNADGTYTLLNAYEPLLDGRSDYTIDWPVPPDYTGKTYRSIAWFGGDADHAKASSSPVFFVIDPLP